MGQNFLIDKKILDKIIQSADIQPTDTILEIGPGLGTLTFELAQKAQKVIAIEKDQAMIDILQQTLGGHDNIEIIQGDVLKNTNYQLPSNYKVVANVPYYITSPIIRMFLETPHQPSQILLMIQKEVAQRICAKPGNMSILAVSVQFYASAKIVAKVSKECFWPAPKVDSAVINIIPHAQKPSVNPELFFEIVKAGFVQPRKQLGNNLSKTLKKDREKINVWLAKNSINPLQRAETLSIHDWEALTASFDMVN